MPNAPAAYPRMVRPASGRVVAGVAQGAAAQLRLDPVVLRLAFVLLTVIDGLGVVAYAALWVFTPKEEVKGRAAKPVNGASSPRTACCGWRWRASRG